MLRAVSRMQWLRDGGQHWRNSAPGSASFMSFHVLEASLGCQTSLGLAKQVWLGAAAAAASASAAAAATAAGDATIAGTSKMKLERYVED